MPWCPHCRTEYEAGYTSCADCGAALSDNPPERRLDGAVVVFEAKSVTEAQIAVATLKAEGVDSFVETTASPSPNIGVIGDDVPELDVVVQKADVERAKAILAEPPITDAELVEIEEAGPQDGTD